MIAHLKALRSNNNLFGILCVLFATLGLSLKAIFIKLIYLEDPSIDAVSILAIRFILAMPFFIFLLIYSLKNSNGNTLIKPNILPFFLLGTVGFYLSAILDFSALAYIPAGLERLILFLYPTFVVLISLIVRPQEVSRNIIFALIISYAGVVVVFIDQAAELTPTMIKGSLLVLTAAIVFAFYTVASVKYIKRFGSVQFTTYAMLAAMFATMSHAFIIHGMSFMPNNLNVYLLVLPMALFSTVLPLILMAEGVKRIGASSASIISTTGPIVTITLAFFVLGEVFGLLQALGGAMIILGVFFVAQNKTKNNSSKRANEMQ